MKIRWLASVAIAGSPDFFVEKSVPEDV